MRTEPPFQGLLDSGTSVYSTDYGYDDASRLQTVGDGTNVAHYSYLANSRMVSQLTFTNSGQLRMTTIKSYDYVNRLTSIGSTNSSSQAVSAHAYTYNEAGQRTRADREDGSYWLYGYDDLGQVTSGRKYWSDNTPVAGMQFEYGFDDIGNRQNASSGGDASGNNLRTERYQANALNQYESRRNPEYMDVLGTAESGATVTVNNQRTYRKGDFYRAELTANNLGGPAYLSLTNLAVLNDSPNADIITNRIGGAFIPARQQVFSYDPDGNTLTDGRWDYTWNGENQLIELQATAVAVSAGAPNQKLEFAYDYHGRRVQKIVSEWNGSYWAGQYTNRFLYDGWNLIAEINEANDLLRSYQWGLDLSGSLQGAGGVGGLLTMDVHSESQEGSYFYAFDGNGNVMAIVAAADESTSAKYDYSPFGRAQIAKGDLREVNVITSSSKYGDIESGHLNFGLRYLDTNLGRWVSRDPINETGWVDVVLVDFFHLLRLVDIENSHDYLYVANQSVSSVDILGLESFKVPDGPWKFKLPSMNDLIDLTKSVAGKKGSLFFDIPNSEVGNCGCTDLTVTMSIEGEVEIDAKILGTGLTPKGKISSSVEVTIPPGRRRWVELRVEVTIVPPKVVIAGVNFREGAAKCGPED